MNEPLDPVQAAVVAEAESWLGTQYVLGGRLKGVGVDCATFLAEILIACGLSPREELGVYSHDWFAHTDADRYMLRLLRHADRTLETVAYRSIDARPGDIVLTKTAKSRVYNHGGVVVAWPTIIHAMAPAVSKVDASTHPLWSYQRISVFTPKRLEAAAETPGGQA